MQHLLRAISGPQAGGTYVLGRRTTIGRASDCDIQILHEGVSRRHAKITLQSDGSVIVTDLSSDNGTFVEEQRITRHRLQPGEALRVMRARFTYAREEGSQVVTSSVFHRKVTSGESLRQTADHGKSLAAIRAGMAKGLADDRVRDRARPQAVAPAPFGARPGGVGPGPSLRLDAERDAVVASGSGMEGFEGRRPTPMGPSPPTPPEVGGRRRSVLSDPVDYEVDDPVDERMKPTRETAPPERGGVVTVGLPTEAPDGTLTLGTGAREDSSSPRGSAHPEAPSEAWGSYGWHAEDTHRGPRDRSMMRASGPPGADPGAARPERPAPAGPSGRMAPSAPAAPVATRTAATPTVPRAVSNGWVRLSPPAAAPRSMRPGSTIAGIPRVGDEVSPYAESPSAPGPAAESPAGETPAGETPVRESSTGESPLDDSPAGEARRGVTAEYGAMTGTSPPAESAPTMQTERVPPDAVTEGMRTLPRIRRITEDSSRPLGSATPTEEVPRVDDEAPGYGPVDDDVYETRPRIRSGARSTRVPTRVPIEPYPPEEAERPEPVVGSVAAERPEPILGSVEAERTEPVVRPSEPAAWPEPGASSIEAERTEPLARPSEPAERSEPVAGPSEEAERTEPESSSVVVPFPGSSASREMVAYEDTLRFERSGDDQADAPGAAAEGGEVPQARKHVSTGELIDALEQLLPIDDDPPDSGQPWPEGGGILAGGVVDDDPRGLRRLVDILEYRELRLRSLRGEAIDAARYDALQRRLQPNPPGVEDQSSTRRYTRFVCSIPAQLTHHDHGSVHTVTVEVADIGAGGAKLDLGEHTLNTGEVVWLAIDLAEADREGTLVPDADTVVFKARVVWTRAHAAQVGLIFAGAPRYGEDVVIDVDA